MAYNPADDRITLPLESLFDLLRDAADEGIRVGKEGTTGDHTNSGIAYTVFREYMRGKPKPTPAIRKGDL